MFCRKCGKKNNEDTKFCEYCGTPFMGELIIPQKTPPHNTQQKSPVVACLLNLVLLGAGFMYLDQWTRGFKYFVVAILSTITFIGPFIMLILAMVKSYELAKLINAGTVEIINGIIIYK